MNRILFIFLSSFLMACGNEAENTPTEEETFEPIPFFEFNEVDHYAIKISEAEIWELGEIDSGQANYEFNRVLTYNYPDELKDTAFLDRLKGMGYVKKAIPSEKHPQLDSLFSEKKHAEFYQFMCIPEYRDILVFKDNDKTVGLAKICFSCDESHILGAQANTKMFGMSGDYSKLWHVLYGDE